MTEFQIWFVMIVSAWCVCTLVGHIARERSSIVMDIGSFSTITLNGYDIQDAEAILMDIASLQLNQETPEANRVSGP